MDIQQILNTPKDKILFLDTETTGLSDEKDEILSLSIIDGNGTILFDHLIKPQRRKRWPEASEIHGIKWKDVKNEKTLLDYEEELAPLFDGTHIIIGYNIQFDLNMLYASGAIVKMSGLFDVMKEYSEVHGTWSEWRSERKWMKLTQCARHYGYKFEAHSSLEDTKATAFCFWKLSQDEEYLQLQQAKKDRIIAEQKQRQETLKKQAEKKERQKKLSLILLVVGLLLTFASLKTNNVLGFIIGIALLIATASVYKSSKK